MKAQDFLLGLRDFFAVVVPGAVFLLLLGNGQLQSWGLEPTGGTLLGFFVAAYLVGSIAAAIGSTLDLPVDTLLASSRIRRRIPGRFNAREEIAEAPQRQAVDRCGVVKKIASTESAKSFWWTHLRLNHPTAIAELDRLEAIQKLFRSLIPVAIVLWAATEFWGGRLPENARITEPWYFLFAGAIPAMFYVWGRFQFLNTLFLLAAATCVKLDVSD